jgi:hypothetical protein
VLEDVKANCSREIGNLSSIPSIGVRVSEGVHHSVETRLESTDSDDTVIGTLRNNLNNLLAMEPAIDKGSMHQAPEVMVSISKQQKYRL